MEYRGYDSAGVAVQSKSLQVVKRNGKVSVLEKVIDTEPLTGTVGIGHTRWATHGVPSDVNAHPHLSYNGRFAVVHNGIIENYAPLKRELQGRGIAFQSDTDTEVLANLIAWFFEEEQVTAEEAVQMALSKVVGPYGIAVLSEREKEKVIFARKGSPLVVGLGQGEYFLASDALPLAGRTNQLVYLNDYDLGTISVDNLVIKNMKNRPVSFTVSNVSNRWGETDKGGYEHYMLKEIFEQPQTIKQTMRGRLLPEQNEIVLGGLIDVEPRLAGAGRMIVVGCGTSWHAALIGKYLIEQKARMAVEVEYASEFRYRNPVLSPGDVVLFISQSGETADTLAALRMAKGEGVLTLGICNVPGSSLSRETDAGVFTHAGTEIGVASTKAFTAQVTVLILFAMKLARLRGAVSEEEYSRMIQSMAAIPTQIQQILEANDQICRVAEKYKDAVNALYLGRGILFPVALEGALKLKEISYIHAEGYAAGEMKHGPIALIDNNLPVVVVAPHDPYYEKLIGNIQEVKAREGVVIAIVTKQDEVLMKLTDDMIVIPETDPALTPLLAVIPLQLMAYHIAVLRGCHVDQPRNLAKSVTVE